MSQSGPLGPSRCFLQKAVASGGSNLARLGELGGKLLPYFAINGGRSEEEKGSAFLALLPLSKLLRKIVSVKKIQAKALPTPDLESILADFMTYQASSKGYCYSMQQQGTQFEMDYSFATYQRESQWQLDYHNEAEGFLNLDDLLMQFRDTIESMQQAFRRTETQISKLVDNMTNAVARKEEERVEIEIHQESILQVATIHHQLTNEEEKHEVSSTSEYPCLATIGYVGGKDKGRLELSVEDRKISFGLFEAMKHSDIGDACFEEEEVEQEIALSTSTMKAVASGGSNLAHLGELGGKLLPYFAINWGRSEEEKGLAFLALLPLSKLLRKIVSVKKIQVKSLDVTSLKELGRLMGPLQRQAFRKVYGKILDLAAAEVFTEVVVSLAQYYDQPLRCFTFGDFQMVPTIEEFEEILGCPLGGRKPYLFSGFLPSLSKIAAVVGDSAKELDRMKQTRNGIVGLPRKYLEGKARDMARQEKWGPLADILALLIFGVVLFPNVDSLVDLAAIDAFLAYHHSKESPVVAILANLFDTFDRRCEKNSARIVCCLPALCVWLISHLFRQDTRHPCLLQSYRSCAEKGGVNWDQHLAGIGGSAINWFPRWKEGKEGVLFSCGDYPNIPLIGTGAQSLKAIQRVHKAWRSPLRKGKELRGIRNGVIRGYHGWLRIHTRGLDWLSKLKVIDEEDFEAPEEDEEVRALKLELGKARLAKEKFKSAATHIRKECTELQEENAATAKALEQETKRARKEEYGREKFRGALWGSNNELKLRREERDRSRVHGMILKEELVACARGGGCRPARQASSARPGEQGCFLQKQPPSGGIFQRAQVGLGAICTPIFTKYTPLCCFLQKNVYTDNHSGISAYHRARRLWMIQGCRMTKLGLCLSSGPPPLDDKRVRITVRYLRVSSGPPPLDNTRVQNDQTWSLLIIGPAASG
ncbi:hypothetical protein HKD37_06G016654 [Glycine soja]